MIGARWCCLIALAAGCTDREVIGANRPGSWVDLRLGVQRSDVDLLFVIDNSPSMGPKQRELANRFPDLVARLSANDQPTHLHIGVVTTDLGAQSFTLAGQCRPGGDGARLQPIGAAATPDCQPPTGGLNFIDYFGAANNLPAGQDLVTTLRCMAAVGDQGCGFEQPLEAAYQALQSPGPPENAGFLRDDALLSVVFVTDEDDCSAPLSGDLFDPAAAAYGPLLSYRCTRFGVVCGTPPAPPPAGPSPGPLVDCTAAPGGELYYVGRYVDFFRLPKSAGGVKPFPGDAFLFAIAAPTQPFSVIDAYVNQPPGVYMPCAAPSDPNCAPVLQHSCVSPSDPAFFGDPAVRLTQVVSQTLPIVGGSICDTSYQPAMQQLAATLASFESGNFCLPGPLDDPAQPDCQVFDEVRNPDGTITEMPMRWCPQAATFKPCWLIDSLGQCGSFYNPQTMSLEHLQLVIERGGAPPPQDSVPRARCVIAPS